MKTSWIAVATATLIGLSSVPAARAGECTASMVDAWKLAKARGWTFECSFSGGDAKLKLVGNQLVCEAQAATRPKGGVIRIGLFGKPRAAQLRNGWTLVDFQAAPAFKILRQPRFVIALEVTEPAPARTHTVYLSSLTLARNDGDCTKMLDEAF